MTDFKQAILNGVLVFFMTLATLLLLSSKSCVGDEPGDGRAVREPAVYPI